MGMDVSVGQKIKETALPAMGNGGKDTVKMGVRPAPSSEEAGCPSLPLRLPHLRELAARPYP